MGKYVEVKIAAGSESDARRTTEEICKKLLANPVMEDFAFETEKGEERRAHGEIRRRCLPGFQLRP